MPHPTLSRQTTVGPHEKWLCRTRIQEQAQNHRAKAEIEKIPFAILQFDLGRRPQRQAERIDQIAASCQQLWAHDHSLGWWDDTCACVVLPNANLNNAIQYADQLMGMVKLDRITVYSSATLHRERVLPGIELAPAHELFAQRLPVWKRFFDIVIGAILLIGVSPLLICLAALVKLTSRGPAFFLQTRVGHGGKPFNMCKLRTMYADAEDRRAELEQHNEQSGSAFKMKNDPRITPIGNWLRSSSLDELPQLFNVVQGSMSLVGPRPLPVTDWSPEDPEHVRRHDVTPGITGLWQINGRTEIPFDDWMEMDLDYVRNFSFLGDLVILLRTCSAVLSGKGAM